MRFFGNIGRHLLSGLAEWLFGHMASAGITPPTEFSLRAILGVVLQILDVTVERVLQRLEGRIGAERVAMIRRAIEMATGAWEWIGALIREGPGGLWRYLQDQLSNLWERVRDAAIGWITQVIITRVSAWLLSLLDPSGIMPVINSILAIYRAIQSFVAYIRQMLEILNSVFAGLASIAKGVIDQAAEFLENALARAIPIAIGFLANQVGLGNISERLREIIEGVRERVNQAIDWLIDRAISVGGAIMSGLSSAAGAVRTGAEAVLGWLGLRRAVRVGAEDHTMFFEARGESGELVIESTRMPLRAFVAQRRNATPPPPQTTLDILDRIDEKARQIDVLKESGMGQQRGQEISNLFAQIAADLASLGSDQGVPPSRVSILETHTDTYSDGSANFSSTDGKHVRAEPLSVDPGGNSGSEPFARSNLWNHVNQRAGAYIRGHLLNNNLFGPGSAENMTPIPRTTNAQMSSGFEEPLKTRVLSQSQVVSYEISVEYGSRAPRQYLASEHRIATAIHLTAYEMKLRDGSTDRRNPSSWEKDTGHPIFNQNLPINLSDVPDTNPFGSEPVLKRVNLKTWASEGQGLTEAVVRRALGAIPGVGEVRINVLLSTNWNTWDDLLTQRSTPTGPLLFDEAAIRTVQNFQAKQDNANNYGRLVYVTGPSDYSPLT